MLQDNCLFVCLIVAARMFSCDFWARFFLASSKLVLIETKY